MGCGSQERKHIFPTARKLLAAGWMRFLLTLITGQRVIGIRGKYGYVDSKGAIAIPPQFDQAFDFDKGLATVRIGDQYGYIDFSGKYVWTPSR